MISILSIELYKLTQIHVNMDFRKPMITCLSTIFYLNKSAKKSIHVNQVHVLSYNTDVTIETAKILYKQI